MESNFTQMSRKRISRTLIIAAFLAIFTSHAFEAEADIVLYASDVSTRQLFTIDPTNAAATLVGDYGNKGIMGGLAYDSANDILFGSDVLTSSLYRVDQSTGAATLIGAFGIGFSSNVQALAYDALTARLYGASMVQGIPSLHQINTTTGAATRIGPLGLAISGLSFNPITHELYGSSIFSTRGVYIINAATGQITSQISTFGFNGISFDPISALLYGVANGGNSSSSLPKGLYTINTQTGTVSLVGALSLNNPLDIQFALAPIPEPGSVALTGVGLTIAFGVLARRRLAAMASLGDH